MARLQREPGTAQDVAEFYDEWSKTFLEVFGPSFQAGLLVEPGAVSEDPVASAQLLAERAAVRHGDVILDAGCGVGGPAIAIAQAFDVYIEGVTISPEQAAIGRQLIEDAGVKDRVRIHLADMHRLPFASSHFDRILIFEALCYSANLELLFLELARTIKPGGSIYIKDIFVEEGPLTATAFEGMQRYEDLWSCIETPRLSETVEALGRAGFSCISTNTLADIGTDRFYSRMLRPGTFELNEVGKHFLIDLAEFPVYWAEAKGVKSAR